MACERAEGWWESSRNWWTDGTLPVSLRGRRPGGASTCGSPVLVELDGEVSHVLQGLVGEGHVHVHVALAAGEGARDLQALGLHRGEPHLLDKNQETPAFEHGRHHQEAGSKDAPWSRSRGALTAFGGTCPPVVMAMPVDSSNRSFRPLLAAGGAGVGDGAKVLGTDDGMKFWPT